MDRFEAMRLFIRVAETGSFSRAARDAHLAQSTVTKQVAALESRLKTRLLSRTTRGVSLTSIGSQFYEKCKAVLLQVDEAEQVLATQNSSVQGQLRIDTSVAFGRRVITPLLMEFMSLHPQIRVDLTFQDGYVDLIAAGIDVAIRMGRLSDSMLGSRHLGYNPWVTIAAPAYLSKAGRPGIPGDLMRHECIVYSSVQGDDVWHYFAPSGERLSASIHGPLRANNLSTVLAAVMGGLGIGIVPYYVAQKAISQRGVELLLEDFRLTGQDIQAVYPSPKLLPARVSVLVAFLKERFSGEWWLRKQ